MPLRLTDTVSFPVESFAAAVTYCGSMHFSRNFILGFLTFFSFLLAFFALAPALPVYLALLGSNAETIGLLVGIFSVSSLFSRFLAGSALRRYSEKSLIMFSSLLFAITFLGCTLLRPFWPFLAVRLVQGVTYAFLDTAVFAWLFKVTPPAHRGRLLGYFMLAPGLAMVMAPSFGMFLANSFSFVILFLWCMGLSLCALLFSGRLKSGKIEKVAPVNRMLRNSFLERKIIAPGMVGFFYNFVYARHGRELMGCKSPVREPRVSAHMRDATRSTSRRQGRIREDGSEGSPRHTCGPTNRNRMIRLSLRASWHNTTKPIGSGDRVNAAVVHGRFTFLSGEICLPCIR